MCTASVSVSPCRKELGSLRLKVQCREERILDTTFYAPFVELMLKAVAGHGVRREMGEEYGREGLRLLGREGGKRA